ncbi:glycosyltransferase [Erythrobacter sp. HL-111]|uniref:glycosyltransferase n=1 Tax=Erythrobacter sp. HL-111 TaxID=1798193 RepID=UPI0006D9562C|nr:glycosyltransferase [Erythrobacter sp. HL-111]KPP96258.1 MAG: Glycosyltransferase [Erythrobacteraceae bacterium HL-111]SDR76013.1 Glycosyltransferase involved in cell wall bisynthesis [Erythrobacter sp. HL-111]
MRHVLSISTLWPNPVAPRFGTFVARSLEALAKRGDWRVTVINPIGLPPIALGRYRELSGIEEIATEGGITVHRPRFTLIPKIGGRRNGAAIARAALPVVERIHAEHPVDLVDAQFFFPDGPAAARIARRLDRPLSIKARGGDITYWGGIDYAREQMLRAARQADGLLAVSEALKREMALIGMERDKITVHYTGLDRDRFRPLAHTRLRCQLGAELGIPMPDHAPLLVCVGALIERKGQHIVLDALTEVPGAHLVLVGRGEQEAQLKGQAHALGLADRVHFVGLFDHDVLPLMLSAADAMVLPSSNEGLANAWVEALACGTAVVTCDVGGAREVITGPMAGRLVARDPKAVAAGINAVLNDPPPRQAVAALVEGFSWEENAARLAEHYARLVAG